MEINKHNQDANKLSQLLFDETFKKSNNPQKPYTTYTGDSTETFTPRETAEKMVEMLDDLDKKSREVNGQIDEQKPGAIWNDKITFLDPSCKTGVFLKVIFDKLDTALQNEEVYGDRYKDVTTRRNHILDNQLFGLTLDNEQSLIASRRNVSGRWDYKNIQYIDKYIDLLEDRKFNCVQDVFEKVKYDVIIGNPPYQKTFGKGNGVGHQVGQQIYQLFVELAANVGRKMVFITPQKWFYGNKKLQAMRQILLSNNHLKQICIYRAIDIFGPCMQNIQLTAFCWDKDYTGQVTINNEVDKYCYNRLLKQSKYFVPHRLDSLITENIQSKKSFQLLISGQTPFGFTTAYHGQDNKKQSDDCRIYFTSNQKNGDNIGYVSEKEIKRCNSAVHRYKVFYPRAGQAWDNKVYTRVILAKPGDVCTQSYLMVGAFDTYDQAYRVKKYMETKFVRYLVKIVKTDHMLGKDKFGLVPVQDFTSNSDIDWTKSVSEIDQQLYKKYSLTDEEIDYIESNIEQIA